MVAAIWNPILILIRISRDDTSSNLAKPAGRHAPLTIVSLIYSLVNLQPRSALYHANERTS